MFLIKTKVKKSSIAGKGVFTLENIKKGQVIGLWLVNAKITTEIDYQKKQEFGDILFIKTGARCVDNYFLYKDCIEDEEFINHSKDSNVLYHCSMCFAKKDIKKGTELTLDYKYVLAEKDVFNFKDDNLVVDGISGRDALLHSTRELLNLIETKN